MFMRSPVHGLRWGMVIAALASAAWLGVASEGRADTVQTKTGQVIEGKIIRKTATGVLFEYEDKGRTRRRNFLWTHIAKLKEGDSAPPPAATPPPAAPGKAAAPAVKPLTPAPSVARRAPTGSVAQIFGPFAQKYCVSCHGPEKQKGKLRLDNLPLITSNLENYDQWQDILAQIDLGDMPPADHSPRPTREEVKTVVDWLTPELKDARIRKQHDSGKTVLRRLNRIQYRNTLRDLLNIDVSGKNDPTDIFPPDQVTADFSNVASALLMSDLLMDAYLRATEVALTRANVGGSRDPEALKKFAEAAFRRPPSIAELAPYLRMLQDKNVESKRVYQAVLCSPNAVYFSERPGPLDHYAVASRLSYFLWNSRPDDKLLALAADKKLRDPAVIAEQVDRLLADPKSQSFVDTFVWEWLRLQNMVDMPPEKMRFKKFYDENLGPMMLAETKMFFRHIVDENRPITDFLDSDYTFVNGTLAKHYGLSAGVTGSGFQKVSLKDQPMRGGLFGQAMVLGTTTDGMSTTPIYRGKWVAEVILGMKLPSPPEDVPDLPDTTGAKTIREQLDLHRNVRECAICHVKIDPLGFAFEAFDPIGGHRQKYKNGRDIETWGKVVGGGSYKDMVGFKKIMLKKKDQFAQTLAGKLMTYATGRKMEASDRSDLRKIVKAVEEKGDGMKDLIKRICVDEMFLSK